MVAWFRKAAVGYAHAQWQWELGHCYDRGKGVAPDAALAASWYAKAAAQDHAKAIVAVARLCAARRAAE